MSDVPAGDEVVIVRVQGTKQPEEESLVRELGDELGILENLRPMRRRAAGNDKHAIVNRVSSTDLKVVSFQV